VTDEERATLRALYAQICTREGAIADFRAKLLALLPIASGAGIVLLADKLNGSDRKLLIAVGLFGVAVTVGLFMYELRGIEDCTVLRRHARDVEGLLQIPGEAHQFDEGSLEGGKWNLADEIGAAWIVYMAVVAGWCFVAILGVSSLSGGWPTWAKATAAVVLLVLYLVVLYVALHGWHGIWGHDYWGERRQRRNGGSSPQQAVEGRAPPGAALRPHA
jgi:hypothetical protein